MPTQLTSASLPSTNARNTSSGASIPTLMSPTWPTSPLSLRNLASAAWRPPTASTSPRSARRLTMYRPINPEPPMTAIWCRFMGAGLPRNGCHCEAPRAFGDASADCLGPLMAELAHVIFDLPKVLLLFRWRNEGGLEAVASELHKI